MNNGASTSADVMDETLDESKPNNSIDDEIGTDGVTSEGEKVPSEEIQVGVVPLIVHRPISHSCFGITSVLRFVSPRPTPRNTTQVEEGREAEATIQAPSSNTRSRTPKPRGTPRGRGRGTPNDRPTPIVWNEGTWFFRSFHTVAVNSPIISHIHVLGLVSTSYLLVDYCFVDRIADRLSYFDFSISVGSVHRLSN